MIVVAALLVAGQAGAQQGQSDDTSLLRADFDPKSVFDPRNGHPLQITLAGVVLSVPVDYFDRGVAGGEGSRHEASDGL